MKKILSILLVLCLTAVLCVPAIAAADENDVVRCTGWYISGSDYIDSKAYEVVLHPKYVTAADSVNVTNGTYTFDNVAVQRRTIDDLGECFVICFVTDERNHPFRVATIGADAFFDENGNGNETLHISDSDSFSGEHLFATSPALASTHVTDVEQYKTIFIRFEQPGTVVYDGESLAESTRSFELCPLEPGEHTLTLSVNGFFTCTYRLYVKTESEILKEEKAELRKELASITVAFFKSIPIAILTFPLMPMVIFGFIWPLAPIELGWQFFHTLSELIHLR